MAAEVRAIPIQDVGLVITLNKRALAKIRDGEKVSLDVLTSGGRVQLVFVRDSVWEEEQRKSVKRQPAEKQV